MVGMKHSEAAVIYGQIIEKPEIQPGAQRFTAGPLPAERARDFRRTRGSGTLFHRGPYWRCIAMRGRLAGPRCEDHKLGTDIDGSRILGADLMPRKFSEGMKASSGRCGKRLCFARRKIAKRFQASGADGWAMAGTAAASFPRFRSRRSGRISIRDWAFPRSRGFALFASVHVRQRSVSRASVGQGISFVSVIRPSAGLVGYFKSGASGNQAFWVSGTLLAGPHRAAPAQQMRRPNYAGSLDRASRSH